MRKMVSHAQNGPLGAKLEKNIFFRKTYFFRSTSPPLPLAISEMNSWHSVDAKNGLTCSKRTTGGKIRKFSKTYFFSIPCPTSPPPRLRITHNKYFCICILAWFTTTSGLWKIHQTDHKGGPLWKKIGEVAWLRISSKWPQNDLWWPQHLVNLCQILFRGC